MALAKRLWRLSFALQRWITPGLEYSQTTFEQRLQYHVPRASSWLDLGCGHRLLPEWRAREESALLETAGFVVGVDSDVAAIRRHRSFEYRCAADIRALPFANGRFDLVTANMVVEHLDDPVAQFHEVARVLAPNGTFLFHTPNARSYVTIIARPFPHAARRVAARVLEGRESVDVYSTYYRANREADIRRIAALTGFRVEQLEYINSSPAFSMFPPLLLPELLFVRQLQRRRALIKYRPAIVALLKKI